jgi:DNA polymerase-3 subunit delta'
MSKSLQQQIIGNAPALSLVQKLADLGRNRHLSGSYILTGHDSVVTARAAAWLFQALACLSADAYPCGLCANCHSLSHGLFPDLYQLQIETDKKGIGIEQIKKLISQLSLSALAGNYRFVLINNAETLSISAANSLLKTLEEPGARIVIVLLVTDLGTLPATIVSRSQLIQFRQVSTNTLFDHLVKEVGLKRTLAKSIAHLSMGKFGLTESYLASETFYNERISLADACLAALTADLSARLSLTERLIKERSADSSNHANLLIVFQTLIRDLLLLNLDQPELIHNDSLRAKLNDCKGRFSLKRLVDATKLISQARLYLNANVNPQLALENFLINL